MNIWDILINQPFEKDADGNELFFPWGVLGKGYVLDSAETKQKIRKFIQLYFGIMLFFAFLWLIVLQPYILNNALNQTQNVDYPFLINVPINTGPNDILLAELPISVIYVGIALTWWIVGIRPFTKALPTSTVGLTWQKAYKKYAKALHPAFLWFGQILSILLVALTLFLILQGEMSLISGSIRIILLGLMALFSGYMIRLRNNP